MKRKIIGIVLVALGLAGAGLTAKSVLVENPNSMEALQDAVYLESGEINPENDGKVVIISDVFELTKPAYDETTGIPINNIHVKCHGQKLDYEKFDKKRFEDEEDYKIRRVLEWVPGTGTGLSNGEGTVGEYKLSDDFIDAIKIDGGYWEDYDEAMLAEAGYFAYEDVKDINASPRVYLDFVEPLEQANTLELNDVRYYYEYADIKDGETVTAVGVQEGNILKKAPGISESFMKGEVSKNEIIKKNESSQKSSLIGSIIICLLLFVSGGNFLFRKKSK